MVKHSSNVSYPTVNVKSSKLFQFKTNVSDANHHLLVDEYTRLMGKTYDIIGDK